MARSDYGPGRRRRPAQALLLEWAAGLLVAIIALIAASSIQALPVLTGRHTPFVNALAGGFGAGLGVWLAMGRLAEGWGLARAAGGGLVAAVVCMFPLLLALEPVALSLGASYAGYVLVPACARLAMAGLRERD